ncbi:MAG: TetR/AcrR family transcriptional regulator [Mycobacteriaceae bacterium]
MTSASVAGTQGMSRLEREEQIIDIAISEFGKRGYAQVSLSAIAELAGVSKTLIVAYFSSKNDLYTRCIHRAGQRLTEVISQVVDDGDTTIEGPIQTITRMLSSIDAHPVDWMLIYDDTCPEAQPVVDVVSVYRNAVEEFARAGSVLILTGRKNIDSVDIDILANAWLGMVSQVLRWYRNNPDINAEDMSERSAKLMRYLVG